jgi:prophage regulatory protein
MDEHVAVSEHERIVRERERAKRTGLSRTTAWRLEREGKFPRRVKISSRACGWRLTEIEQWILSRTAGVDGTTES